MCQNLAHSHALPPMVAALDKLQVVLDGPSPAHQLARASKASSVSEIADDLRGGISMNHVVESNTVAVLLKPTAQTRRKTGEYLLRQSDCNLKMKT